jgi:hypothetical protein
VDGATSDDVVFQQEFLQPQFTDTVNSARVYPFAVPVSMPAGKFYIGLIQPALSGSDSLFYALDVNRVGSNHLYFNVLNQWEIPYQRRFDGAATAWWRTSAAH